MKTNVAEQTRYRIGVDIGGTFTDFSIYDLATGRLHSFKTPTVPLSPAQGVANGLRALADLISLNLHEVDYFVHGTTIGVNAILQRSGAPTALFVTRGFRDILELQRLRLPNPFDFYTKRPKALVPRRDVYEITERIRSDGGIDTPLNEEDVSTAITAAQANGIQGVAVCLVNSYRNPVHERRIRELLTSQAPDLHVSISSDVWPQMREYERAIATIINVYVQPAMTRYLKELEQVLEEGGAQVRPYITKSNGGVMTASSARTATSETLLSGPASGVTGAAYVAELAGLDKLLTFDMGGTSADIAVITEGAAQTSTNEHVGDFPIILPAIAVSAIGAGGGSIAWIDAGGILRVGPRSAGADPGPVCYGLGGHDPTLTDALLVVGLLAPDCFAGGQMSLSRELAESALAELGRALRLSATETAEAVIRVALSSMYAEFSNLIYRRGLDPREFTLVAFGGAGPLVGCLLAREFRMAGVLVPQSPGTLSAFGALAADVKVDYIRSIKPLLDGLTSEYLGSEFNALRRRGLEWIEKEGPIIEDTQVAFSADTRYVGQSFDIKLSIEPSWLEADDVSAMASAFHQEHERLFAHADEAAAIELVDLQARVVGTTPKPCWPVAPEAASADAPVSSQRSVTLGGEPLQVSVYRRRDLQSGHCLPGPAIVEQDDTTVFIPQGFRGDVTLYGAILIYEESSDAA